MNRKQIIKLLKSGNFTIIYWDNDEATLYKGKWDYNKEYEKDDYGKMNKNEVKLEIEMDGYLPEIVKLLSEALGGKTDSI